MSSECKRRSSSKYTEDNALTGRAGGVEGTGAKVKKSRRVLGRSKSSNGYSSCVRGFVQRGRSIIVSIFREYFQEKAFPNTKLYTPLH